MSKRDPFDEKPEIPKLTVTFEQIRDAFSAVSTLMSREDLPVRSAIQLRRIFRVLKPLALEVNEDYRDLAEKHAERDEQGEVIYSGPAKQAVKLKDQKAFDKDVLDLMVNEAREIQVKPIKLSNLLFDMDAQTGIGWQIDGLAAAGLLIIDMEDEAPPEEK